MMFEGDTTSIALPTENRLAFISPRDLSREIRRARCAARTAQRGFERVFFPSTGWSLFEAKPETMSVFLIDVS